MIILEITNIKREIKMTYYYPIPDSNTYKPQTEAQRNYLARKNRQNWGGKKGKKIPHTDINFKDSKISRKKLDDYIKFIYQGRIWKWRNYN